MTENPQEAQQEVHVQALLQPKKRSFITSVAEVLSQKMPDLKKKLKMADMGDNPVEFLEKALPPAAAMSFALLVLTYILLYQSIITNLEKNSFVALMLMVLPLVSVPAIVFAYFMLYPDAAALRRQREMDYEVVFAGRHIAIALKSGMPLFDTLVGASKGYGAVSKEFARIVDQVVLGVPVTQAIRDSVQYNPSKYFIRMMLQIANSISSGADVGDSLEGALDQISKEQVISLKEYSQKLTPMVMFYMVLGIIVPSLGVVLATVIFSAVSGGSFGFSSSVLVLIFFIIALVQFLFLGFIESSRPKYLI